MNARIKHKIFNQWSINPRRAYARYGFGKVLHALNGACLYCYPGNGYRYWTCLDGRIVKIKNDMYY